MRMVGAYALMPFVAGALTFLAEMTLWSHAGNYVTGTNVHIGGSAPEAIALSLAMGVGLVAVFVTIFGAVPLVAWSIRRGRVSLRQALVAGAALGNAPIAVLFVLIVIHHIGRGTMPDNPGNLFYGAGGAFRTVTEGFFVGMGCAAVFWAVAIRGSEVDKGRPVSDA
jgi:hypothetical protein